jgi:uracil-DNA glycosylase
VPEHVDLEHVDPKHVDPKHVDIEGLKEAAVYCKGCELWQHATQVVFSAGNPRAPLALVGEQPGDVEDRQGIPFLGPAGRLLQEALEEAGVPRKDVYVTNAVKHFRFTERGTRYGDAIEPFNRARRLTG